MIPSYNPLWQGRSRLQELETAGHIHSQRQREHSPAGLPCGQCILPTFTQLRIPGNRAIHDPRSSHPNRILKSLTDTSTDQLKLDLSPLKVSPPGMLDYVKLTIKPNPTATKTPHCRLYLSSTHHSMGALFSPGVPQCGLWLHLGFFYIFHCVAKGFAQWMCLRRNGSGCLGDGLGAVHLPLLPPSMWLYKTLMTMKRRQTNKNTKFKAAHRRKADDEPSTGLLGTGYASDPLNGGHLLFTLVQILLGTFPKCSISQYKSFILKK